MITLPPYTSEEEAYHEFPVEDRWIFNKLSLAERLGYRCGPLGTEIPAGLEVVIRPIMNVYGDQRGGGFYFSDNRHENFQNYRAGYFWCEKFSGLHEYVHYTSDLVVAFSQGEMIGNILHWKEVDSGPSEELPLALQNKSRYLLVERIGGNIIEVSPRHPATDARRSSIEDYKQFDPDYDPQDIVFGYHTQMKRVPHPSGGYQWTYDETTPIIPHEMWGD